MTKRVTKLRRPCGNCPFRRRPKFLGLGRERRAEIADGLIRRGVAFHCHKTIVYDDDESGEGRATIDSQFCAGALLVLENEHKGREGGPGCGVNQTARILMRLGVLDPNELQGHDNAYGSLSEWEQDHDDR